MRPKWDWVLTSVLVVCALITTGLVARRELFGSSTTSTSSADQKAVLIRDWKSQLRFGIQIGPTSAPVQLIEFADFECPFCGDFHKKVKLLQEHFPMQVALTYVHFPLQGHRFALPAARVAECAGDQGRFEAMYDRLFDEQDSFGLKPWSDYATESGVPDLSAFDACIKKADVIPHIRDGRILGEKLDVRATPTLIINGWRLPRPPSSEELDAMVKAVLAGKSPVSAVQGS